MPTEIVERQYLYCFFRGDKAETFSSKGMGERGDPVVTQHYKDLAAVVSVSPESEYDNSRRHMLNHTKVLEEVMEHHSILPVRFNTISPDLQTLHRLLSASYA